MIPSGSAQGLKLKHKNYGSTCEKLESIILSPERRRKHTFKAAGSQSLFHIPTSDSYTSIMASYLCL